MNEALELAGKLDAYSRGDEYQRVTEEAAAMLRSQHAEIEGWKKDQKENLKNQCDLHAEIERCHGFLITLAAKEADNLHQAFTLRTESQKLRSNHERLQKLVDEGSASGLAYTASLELEAENQKLRDALENVSNMSEELSISRYARAALGETK